MQDQDIDTILGEDISFRGKLEFKRNLKINGKFRGQIQTGGALIVGSSAEVEADVQAGSIIIQGKMRGNLQAKTRIELHKGGKLHGDMQTAELAISPGSNFTGSCTMD